MEAERKENMVKVAIKVEGELGDLINRACERGASMLGMDIRKLKIHSLSLISVLLFHGNIILKKKIKEKE